MHKFHELIREIKSSPDFYDIIYDLSEMLDEKAVGQMQNADGTTGEHWTHEQTTSAAKNHGIVFDEDYNSWDWYYVMNMLYSDMSMLLGKDTTSYVKATEAWLEDKDVAPGKAFRYYTKVVM